VLDSLDAAITGLQQLLTWPTPGYLLAGVLIGYVVGILPGLGASAALAFLLPAVVSLAPIDAFVLLTATSAVAAIGGDLTSILLGVPGEATAAAIVADGHALAKRGEGRYATGAAVTASMMGALFGMGVLVAFVPFAPRVLAHVGSPELAALAIVGICLLGAAVTFRSRQGPVQRRAGAGARDGRARSISGRTAIHVRAALTVGRPGIAANGARHFCRC
jgi:TctA family transporter